MGLVNLSTTEYPDQWIEFWFNNWIDHQEIQQAIQKKNGMNLPIYVIDPWVQDSADELLRRHQFYHNDMNLVIGLNGEDLAVLDFNDEKAIQNWVYQHYQEHLAARQILGLA